MKSLLAAAAVVIAGCAHSAGTPAGRTWISSDSSQYSPVARLRALTALHKNGIEVVVDSGTLSVPGDPIPNGPPLMSQLYLTAILAERDSSSLAVVTAGDARGSPERRGWHPVATSDSVLLADALHYGETVRIPHVRLTVPVQALPAGPAWIIYRITGNGVVIQPPAVPGGPLSRRDYPGGVRVYACGDHDVRGAQDASRAASLKAAYGIAC
jgi:hypothetical protein